MAQTILAPATAALTLPAGAALNVSGSGIVHVTPPGQNVRELVLFGNSQMIGPYRTDAYVQLLAGIDGLDYEVTIGYGTVGDPVTVPDLSGEGITVTATLAIGWIASGWQWKRVSPSGTVSDIAGATSASYTQVADDVVPGTRIYPQPTGLTFVPYGVTADGASSPSPAPAPPPPAPAPSPAGTLALSASTYSAGEAAGSVAVVVTRSGGSTGAASAQVSTSPGSASSGSDFTSTTQTANWASGDAAAKTVNVPIVNDTSVEGNETFTVTLSAATGATLGSPTTATVTIVDDDSAPDTRPRYGVGSATAGVSTPAALLASMTPIGSNGSRVMPSFNVNPGAGQGGWVAILASASASGVTFANSALETGGWQGASFPGNPDSTHVDDGGSPNTSTVTYDDGVTTWRFFRTSYLNAPGDFTTS